MRRVPGPQGIWIGCAGVDHITLISQGSLKPVQSLRVDSGGYTPQIIPGQQATWILTPSGLARAARPPAGSPRSSAPAMPPAPCRSVPHHGRLWITGSGLTVVMPGSLTAHPVGVQDLVRIEVVLWSVMFQGVESRGCGPS
jgi:hypothetical protein